MQRTRHRHTVLLLQHEQCHLAASSQRRQVRHVHVEVDHGAVEPQCVVLAQQRPGGR